MNFVSILILYTFLDSTQGSMGPFLGRSVHISNFMFVFHACMVRAQWKRASVYTKGAFLDGLVSVTLCLRVFLVFSLLPTRATTTEMTIRSRVRRRSRKQKYVVHKVVSTC